METKRRALVREILNPVLDKTEHEQERYTEIDKRSSDFLARLEVLEYSFFHNRKSQKAPTIFDTILQRFSEGVSASSGLTGAGFRTRRI